MKHYVLVSVQPPPKGSPAASQVWNRFLYTTEKIELRSKGSQKLAENVWLLERENDVVSLSQIVVAAGDSDLAPAVLFLSSD